MPEDIFLRSRGQKTLRVEGLDYVDDVELFNLWTIDRNKKCQKPSPNLVKMARDHWAYWNRAVEVVIPVPEDRRKIGQFHHHEVTKPRHLPVFLHITSSGIAFAIEEDPMKKAGLVVLSAGAGGMLVWLGVLGQDWLRRELAYQRWRRLRIPQRPRFPAAPSPVSSKPT